jgi:prepilin-type N-terminal cleavage/methylation domain-containing protein
MNRGNKLKSKKGFTLVEMVTVIVIFGMILAGAFAYFSFALRSTIVVTETSQMQMELRNMLIYFKNNASVAERALITNTEPDAATLAATPNPWKAGTLIFCKEGSGGRGTLVIKKFNGTDTIEKEKIRAPLFNDVDGFELEFKKNEVDTAKPDIEKYSVSITLRAKGNDLVKTEFIESVFFANKIELEIDPVGSTDPMEYFVVQPAEKFRPVTPP